MDKEKIAVATITWARDQEEQNLLTASLQRLAATGLKVFVTDGGSPPAFLDFLKSNRQFSVLQPEEKGLWAQAKNSLLHAQQAGVPFILYTEPDKQQFFEKHLIRFLDTADDDPSTGIRLACRTASAFSSFPRFQQMSETTINNCCGEVTGINEDYTYGPFLLNSAITVYLKDVKEDIGWGWRPYVFTIAHRLGYTLKSYYGDFLCPPEQQQDTAEERLYRMKQLEQNIYGIRLSATVTLDGRPAAKEPR